MALTLRMMEHPNATTDAATATSAAATPTAAIPAAGDYSRSLAWLVGSVGAAQNHSHTGEIGWPYMVRSLAAAGKLGNDVLSAMVSRTDSPSYGFQLEQGATTLAESWEAKYGMSWNHAVDGHIDDWFCTHIAGLRAGTETRHYPKAPPRWHDTAAPRAGAPPCRRPHLRRSLAPRIDWYAAPPLVDWRLGPSVACGGSGHSARHNCALGLACG